MTGSYIGVVSVTTQPGDKRWDRKENTENPEHSYLNSNTSRGVQFTVSPTVHPVVIPLIKEVECREHGHVDKTAVEEAHQMAHQTGEYPLVADEGDNTECHGEES